jgi:hypothetical protein
LWSGRRARRGTTALAVAGAGVAGLALVLSASRAGAVGAGVVLVALALSARRKAPAIVPAAVAAAVLLLGLAVGWPSKAGLLSTRLRSGDQATWHRAAWLSTPESLRVRTGDATLARVTIENAGTLAWPVRDEQPVHVSYHWLDAATGRTVAYEGLRTPLPGDLAPGGRTTVGALVLASVPPGTYHLQWDMVREGVTWFGTEGGPVAVTRVEVIASPRPARIERPRAGPVPRPEVRPARLELWDAALRMWQSRPLVGVGPDNFRRLYGPWLGLDRFDERITANSLYVETLVTLGLLGTSAWMMLLVALARGALGWWRASRQRPADTWTLALLAAVAAFLLHGLLDYFLGFTPTYGLFWIAAGAAARLTGGDDEGRGAGSRPGAARADAEPGTPA